MEMLSYCRPHDGSTVDLFCARYLETLPGVQMDSSGNYHVEIGKGNTTLYSCHTDTVHWKDGMQTLHLSADGTIGLSKRSRKRSSCLGADDTVGVFLMREMILAHTPGYYIFHYGEESGGIGSSELAERDPNLLRRFQCAIALDRGGNNDVITHQGGSRCCSDSFARSLADQLGSTFTPCPSGVYTDTAEYTALIPECTNVSVGYQRAHSKAESINYYTVDALLQRLLVLDSSKLIIERDPTVRESSYTYRNWLFPEYADTDPDVCEVCGADEISGCYCYTSSTTRESNRYRDMPMYLDPDWQAVQDELARESRFDRLVNRLRVTSRR